LATSTPSFNFSAKVCDRRDKDRRRYSEERKGKKVAIKASEISAPCSEDGLKLFDVRIDIKGGLIFL
jgi:hypothetical protein